MYEDDGRQDSRKYFQASTTLADELIAEMVTFKRFWSLGKHIISCCRYNAADWGYTDNNQLRGWKFTLWKDGVPAFITGCYLSKGSKKLLYINQY